MMESDADRLNMLRALGGSDDVLVRSKRVTGLLQKEPIRTSFDEINVSADSLSLRCLMLDAKANGFAAGDSVEYPNDDSSYFIADIQDEDGMALIELRKE